MAAMRRYVAFLRGVSPMNAKMPELKKCFEAGGFSDVCTLLSSGNVVFNARSSSVPALERRAEKAIQSGLGHSFATIVRSAEYLQNLARTSPPEPWTRFENVPGHRHRRLTAAAPGRPASHR